jgi:hypothetical protein
MITVIAEHSADLSLLPEKANILDIGCRGFLFSDELQRLGYKVYPVDCDLLLEAFYGKSFYHLAITDYDGFTDLYKTSDPQATRINRSHDTQSNTAVRCMTLKSFSESVEVDFWDLIKIDIEGAEYEVIMSLTEPPAKQLSIEFHLHTGIYHQKEMAEMEYKLVELGYEAVSHTMTSQHGCGYNYWDSLFILK